MGEMASQITSLTIVYSTVFQAQTKENIKAPRHWPLWGEFTGDRWFPRTKGQQSGKWFHLMTSSWSGIFIGSRNDLGPIWFHRTHRKDHSGYGFSQWETTLKCDIVSHSLIRMIPGKILAFRCVFKQMFLVCILNVDIHVKNGCLFWNWQWPVTRSVCSTTTPVDNVSALPVLESDLSHWLFKMFHFNINSIMALSPIQERLEIWTKVTENAIFIICNIVSANDTSTPNWRNWKGVRWRKMMPQFQISTDRYSPHTT